MWHSGQLKPSLLPQLCISGGRYRELKRQRSWRQWAGRQWPWRHASWTFLWYVYISTFIIFLSFCYWLKRDAIQAGDVEMWLYIFGQTLEIDILAERWNILNSFVVFHPNNQNKNPDQGMSRLFETLQKYFRPPSLRAYGCVSMRKTAVVENIIQLFMNTPW